MEISDAVGFFATQPVLDAYSSALLFNCHSDLYDASKRDAEAGWRRVLSAPSVTVPARGCIKIGEDVFIAGRSSRDYFDGGVIREYLLLHPSDGLMTGGSPDKFLGVAGASTFYAGVSWVKDNRPEVRTSEIFSTYDIYCSESETITPGMLILTPDGRYLRVFGEEERSGGLAVLPSYDLGANALRSVNYTSVGAYDPTTDSSSASAPILVSAIVEHAATGYNYTTNAAEKYERADRIVTVRQSVVTSPVPGDKLVDLGDTFRVLERQPAPGSCWALHVRPV